MSLMCILRRLKSHLESFKKMFETSLPSDLDSDNYSEKLKERERAFDFEEIRIEQGRVI